MSQFALDFGTSEFYQCLAVSLTSDPTGAYYQYEYVFGNDINDYPKFGIWPDAYYMTVRQSSMDRPLRFRGFSAIAFDRAAMLDGSPATAIAFDIPGQGGVLPSDLDGSNPAPGGHRPTTS